MSYIAVYLAPTRDFSNTKSQYFKIFVINSNHLAELGRVLAVCSVEGIHTPSVACLFNLLAFMCTAGLPQNCCGTDV